MGASNYGVGMRGIDRRCRELAERQGREPAPVTVRWLCTLCGQEDTRRRSAQR